jgi:imidazolonepropionase-like amidohydrolase
VTGAQVTDTAFVGAILIDGTGSPPQPDSAVVVHDGWITWVGTASDLDRTPHLQEIDVTGKYLIPGLMDANVHLVLHCDPEVLLRYEPGCYDALVIEAAQVALRAGITTVFDTWGPLESLRRVRDRINAGEVTGSRIFFGGNIIGNSGPWSPDIIPTISEALSPTLVGSINQHWEQGVGGDLPWMSADDVRLVVRDYIATSGIDFVKYASSAHASVKFIAFSPDAQRAIVEEAHAAGLLAQACALAPEALKLAINAGVDLLQHVDHTGRRPMPTETLDLIVKRQLPCVAIMRTERFVAAATDPGQAFTGGLWRELGPIFRDYVGVADGNDRRLIEAGVKLMLATDGGVFGPTGKTSPAYGPRLSLPDVEINLGRSHILWFQAAIERDMPAMDALLSATRNIAQGYGKSDELGTVEPGKRADLLVLDADPLDNVENYGRIAHIVKDGELVDRERLPEQPVLTRGGDQS